MSYDLRWVVIFFCNLLLIFLTAEVNHYLSPLALQLFLGGLLLAFGVLRLQLRQGLIANALTALVMDAANPLPFGLTFLLMVTAHLVLFSVRSHFAREILRSNLLIAIALNLLLMVVIALFAARGHPFPASVWSRTVADSTISIVAILVVAPWFFALQQAALASIGIDLDAEQREAQ